MYVEFCTQSAKHQFSADILKYFLIFQRNMIYHFMQIVSKCRIVFWKKISIINMYSAEIAQEVLNINFLADNILK